MSSVFARGNRLYAKIRDIDGRWIQLATGFAVGQEAQATKWVADRDNETARARDRKGGASGPLTVSLYAETWLKRRKTKTVKDDRNRIERHALPHIGALPIVDVRPRHLRDLIVALKDAGQLAPKTIREISGVLHSMFKSAVIDELIATNPVQYERGVLPKKVDKDPTWRHEAIFTRPEVETILSDERIPHDRRVFYALKFFTGRHSEVASLTWSQYDPTARPLGRLALGYTKTGIPRAVPVHPTFAKILAEWKLSGWEATYGRKPKPGDLIVSTRKGLRRKAGESQQRFVYDLGQLGLRTSAGTARHRRGHDLRRTFITLARSDGAIDSILRLVTHGPKAGEMLDLYSSQPWEVICGEVAKLKIGLLGSLVQFGAVHQDAS